MSHAASIGANAEKVSSIENLEASRRDEPAVTVIETDTALGTGTGAGGADVTSGAERLDNARATYGANSACAK